LLVKKIIYADALDRDMTMAVLADFDRTVTETDASYAVLEGFADPQWRRIEEDAYARKYTIREALRLQADLVRAGKAEADAHVLRNVMVRDGFPAFARLCRSEGVHLEICSDGFGHTIPLILERAGLGWIPWTSNRTWFEGDRMRIGFDHSREGCPVNANCKCSHLEHLEREHDRVVFVGDGLTDACVAARAKVLFARDHLAQYCDRQGIAYTLRESWDDIARYLRSTL